MRKLTIKNNESGQRMDKFLLKYMPFAGKSFIYKMIRKKNILLNGLKCSGNEILSEKDTITLWMSDSTIDNFRESPDDSGNTFYSQIKPLEADRIIYEDNDIILYNKPAGLLSQKALPEDISAVEMLISYLLLDNKLTYNDLLTFKPSFCNRLDRNTSGILAGGKSLKGLQMLSDAFKNRTLHKDYLAIVQGAVSIGQDIEAYLHKNDRINKVAISKNNTESESEYIHTEFKPLYSDGSNTLLIIRLYTGKSHQIRAQLEAAGHPILGDLKYNGNNRFKKDPRNEHPNHQLLHAFRLTFSDGSIFTAPIPDVFKKYLKGYAWEPGKLEAFEDLPLKI